MLQKALLISTWVWAAEANLTDNGFGINATLHLQSDLGGSGKHVRDPLQALSRLLLAKNPAGSRAPRKENGAVIETGQLGHGVRLVLAFTGKALSIAFQTLAGASGLLLMWTLVTGEFLSYWDRVSKDIDAFMNDDFTNLLTSPANGGNFLDAILFMIFAPLICLMLVVKIVMLPGVFIISIFTEAAETALKLLPHTIISAVLGYSFLPAPALKRAVTVLKYTGAIFWGGMGLGMLSLLLAGSLGGHS